MKNMLNHELTSTYVHTRTFTLWVKLSTVNLSKRSSFLHKHVKQTLRVHLLLFIKPSRGSGDKKNENGRCNDNKKDDDNDLSTAMTMTKTTIMMIRTIMTAQRHDKDNNDDN